MNYPDWHIEYCFECECNGELPMPHRLTINHTLIVSLWLLWLAKHTSSYNPIKISV